MRIADVSIVLGLFAVMFTVLILSVSGARDRSFEKTCEALSLERVPEITAENRESYVDWAGKIAIPEDSRWSRIDYVLSMDAIMGSEGKGVPADLVAPMRDWCLTRTGVDIAAGS